MKVYNLIKTEDIETIKNKLLDIKTIINNDKDVFNMMYKDFKQFKDKDISQYIYFN